MRVLARLLALALGAAAVSTSAAEAHGPCGCLDAVLGEAGGRVRITGGPGADLVGRPNYPAYKVIFNPRPSQLGIAPDYLTSAYRADAPSVVVLSRPRRDPTRRGRFRIPPRAAPGLYMVLIFDGGEGGAHNTWDYLHVTDWDELNQPGVVAARDTGAGATSRAARPRDSAGSGGDTSEWGPWAAGLLAAIVVSVWGAAQVGRRRRKRPA